ncbi:hypothetical protein ACS0TY_022070 [Phlomoides rotata]
MFITIEEKRIFRGNWRRPLYSWEEDQVQNMLQETEAHMKASTVMDHWTWKLTKDGVYSVNSAYLELDRRKSGDISCSAAIGIIWNKNVPLKIAAFSWKLLQDRVPTMWNLLQRGAFNPKYSLKCRVCGKFDEDTKHLFFDCCLDISVWKKVHQWFDIGNLWRKYGMEHLEGFVTAFRENQSLVSPVFLLLLWCKV